MVKYFKRSSSIKKKAENLSKLEQNKVNKIINNFEPVAIDINDYSVLIKDKNSKFQAWIDTWVDNKDIDQDWNQYIFHTDDVNDRIQKAVQEDDNVFDLACNEALSYLQKKGLIIQGDDGWWSYGNE